MKQKIVTWTLGVLTLFVVIGTLVSIAPTLQRWDFLPKSEYKYLSLSNWGTTIYGNYPKIQQLKSEGWVVDDLLVDSCGNMTLVFRKK